MPDKYKRQKDYARKRKAARRASHQNDPPPDIIPEAALAEIDQVEAEEEAGVVEEQVQDEAEGEQEVEEEGGEEEEDAEGEEEDAEGEEEDAEGEEEGAEGEEEDAEGEEEDAEGEEEDAEGEEEEIEEVDGLDAGENMAASPPFHLPALSESAQPQPEEQEGGPMSDEGGATQALLPQEPSTFLSPFPLGSHLPCSQSLVNITQAAVPFSSTPSASHTLFEGGEHVEGEAEEDGLDERPLAEDTNQAASLSSHFSAPLSSQPLHEDHQGEEVDSGSDMEESDSEMEEEEEGATRGPLSQELVIFNSTFSLPSR
uniref:Uncharacterized protein n=1 Tax=Chromera velia CCMP2878 TaxID=1169474 RepID=A0A0G4F021_9ALVE|eukprot:Cvel_2561.t1-p1 / transcript=Cvel_2561.t1 / gene=Cvel_2561 / organism=Chromera_velia_CCMP2878 / gene_product=hypothetical protein / transcript_product=hypothetical protein / location=Cvel_scaffold101:78228-79166(+) / protein_length=313 / sequence_SO=supercontig / SO=protein_coding / is_pseudo=false